VYKIAAFEQQRLASGFCKGVFGLPWPLTIAESHTRAQHEQKKGFVSPTQKLYQIALPATHLRRCGGFVNIVQLFDLTHVYGEAPRNNG
jgi:hypothetical protein